MQIKGIMLKFLSVFIVLFFSLNFAGARYEVDPKIEKVVVNFLKKVERKYDSKKEIIYLEKINSKINKILERKKLSSKKIKLLNDIVVLFNEKIFELEYENSLKNNSQIFVEAKILNDLEEKLSKINIPNYIKNTGNKIIRISDNQEFIEDNDIKKIFFTKYYIINSSNYKQLKNRKGIFLVNKNGIIWFIEKYSIETKNKYSIANKLFEGYITEKTRFFKEKNTFYSYNFKGYKFFDDKYGFYKSTLKQNDIYPEKSLLYLGKNNKYYFINDFKKVKLIDSDIIYGIVDKKDFLDDLSNDKLYLTEDTDYLFEKLKLEINKLTKNKTREEKIKLIYDFILNKIEYTKNLDLEDKKIFSGILAYKNSNGVCEAYVKLMSYALKFAGISDVRVIRGDVIDAKDFPKIGHAWLRIGDKYYDPTFDDPIGQIKTKEFSEYKYFALPKDLFYTNRFDYGDTPEYLKTKSLTFRHNLVNQNLSKLVEKYKKNNFLLLKGIKFNKENNIDIGEKITIENAKKIIPYYEVEEKQSGEIIFYKDGIKKNITKLQYFVVDNSNIEQVFIQKNYETDGLYLFHWKKKDGNYEYRIGFDIVIK